MREKKPSGEVTIPAPIFYSAQINGEAPTEGRNGWTGFAKCKPNEKVSGIYMPCGRSASQPPEDRFFYSEVPEDARERHVVVVQAQQ